MLLARALLATIPLVILSAPLAADAQPEKVVRIGVLWGWEVRGAGSPVERELLQLLGYKREKTVRFLERGAKASLARAREAAAELARLNPDVIVAVGAIATQAVKEATKTIPIVMTGVDDPVALGLVSSLARPGGNITGPAAVVPGEFYGKQLQLLKETVPTVSRVAILQNPDNPAHSPAVRQELTGAAARLKLRLQFYDVKSYGELDGAFKQAVRDRDEALLVLDDAVFLISRDMLAVRTTKARLPAIYRRPEYVDAGGLMSYGPRTDDMYRAAARYADKVLKGAKPADLPVEQPTRFELIINLKTDRQGPWPHDPAVRPLPGGPPDPVGDDPDLPACRPPSQKATLTVPSTPPRLSPGSTS